MKHRSLLIAVISILLINLSNSFAGEGNHKENGKVEGTSFQGTITDKITGESLAGVLVKLNNQDKEVYTDFDGNFCFLNIVPGKYQISTSYISYQEITKNILIDKVNNVDFDVEIETIRK